jgi:hypothetical protein
MAGREWTVEFHPKGERWARDLPSSDAEALLAAIRVLRDRGPRLGRPLVDTIKAIPIADERFEKHQAALGMTSDATRKRKRR